MGFLPYHKKLGEVLSNALCILHLYNSAIFFQHSTIFFMLINGKKNFSNNDVNDSVVYSVIYIYT